MPTTKVAAEYGQRIHDLLMDERDKEAAMEASEYTRLFHREASFRPNVISDTPFDASKLVPQTHTSQPVMLFEYEVPSPGAMQVDFGESPPDFLVKGRRYPLTFQKVTTQRAVYETLELHTYGQDVRAIVADGSAKELAARDDHKLINAVYGCVGAPGDVQPWVSQTMHVDLAAQLDVRSFAKGSDLLRGTEYSIPSKTVLFNHMHSTDFYLMGVAELQGTQRSVDIVFNGFNETDFKDHRLLFTIKKKLVPIGVSFWFAGEDWLGRYCEMVPPTMEIKRQDTQVQTYLYKVSGLTIANPAAVGINRYLSSQ